ncbi:hypothetical protein [Streptomyces uncialis]|uniref:hypothetical protein n=1 Tax=Streptomyces uncialis TaxID=1048205 RepID=UPI00224FDBE1|nr:hypothetical protein [Streptomyces uncialis]MCX4659154.1 hypothetical protein [Streptomyces uncialis]WTE14062.1 hypothetical protein OG924_29855 [Streptomyces uncialis]
MHRSSTTTAALCLTAVALLALPACSSSAPSPVSVTSAPARSADPEAAPNDAQPTEVLTPDQLRERLLDETDLGQGYTRKPERNSGRDDVTVIGCPALEKLGGNAAAGGSLDFPNRAKAAFTYTGSADSEVTEELYSDTETRLSSGTKRIFDAMVSCPVYQVVVGSTPVKMATQKLTAPALGDERWSQLLTATAGGRSSIVKQTAVRTGTVLMVVSGSPGLVDTYVDKALAKAVSPS